MPHASIPIASGDHICFASSAAASARLATTSATLVRRTAVPVILALDPVSKSIVLGGPAPFTGAGLSARLVAVSATAAADRVAKPAARLLPLLKGIQLNALQIIVPLSNALRVFLAFSDRIGVDALGEVGGVHDAEVAADKFSLLGGEFGGRYDAAEAEGSSNGAEQDGWLHVGVLGRMIREKSREERSDCSLL